VFYESAGTKMKATGPGRKRDGRERRWLLCGS